MEAEIQNMLAEIEKGEAQLFDVREEEEWEEGHLKIAHFLPLSALESDDLALESFDKRKKTYLHCRSGNRVLKAAPILEEKGFEKVICLEEGFEMLSEEGLEIEAD